MRTALIILGSLSLFACGSDAPETPVGESLEVVASDPATNIVARIEAAEAAGEVFEFETELDQIAADYVKLALHFGAIDDNYVDAYHGPASWWNAVPSRFDELTDGDPTVYVNDLPRWPEWRAAELQKIGEEAVRLREALSALASPDETEAFRAAQLDKVLRALLVRLDVVSGKPVPFNTEVELLYDVEPPLYDLSQYDAILAEIDALLPGEGSTADRVDAFRNSLAIPEDKLQPVFARATAECRARTVEHYELPEGESFRMEFVNDKPWSGSPSYQGDVESLLQINTDVPSVRDRAGALGGPAGSPRAPAR
ncbi:MAG: hypothetical protein AAFV54_15505 [Pseudomonadota bacterium]